VNRHVRGRHVRGSRIGLGAGTTALVVGLVGFLVAPMAIATHVQPELITATANQTCDDLAEAFSGTVGAVSWTELKQDPPGDGEESDGTLTVTITNFDGKSFDWSSNIGVDAVYVKAGSAGSYLYIYEPPAESTGDTGLTTPGDTGNAISHIAFCSDLEDTTTTVDDSSTTTVDDSSTTTVDDSSTTTVDDSSTTTVDDSSTTTVDDSTTTTVDDSSTTTDRERGTTTTPPPTTPTPTDEVLATTITAAPTTVEIDPVDTLPFTGVDSGTYGLLAMALIGIGALTLTWARGFRVGRHESPGG